MLEWEKKKIESELLLILDDAELTNDQKIEDFRDYVEYFKLNYDTYNISPVQFLPKSKITWKIIFKDTDTDLKILSSPKTIPNYRKIDEAIFNAIGIDYSPRLESSRSRFEFIHNIGRIFREYVKIPFSTNKNVIVRMDHPQDNFKFMLSCPNDDCKSSLFRVIVEKEVKQRGLIKEENRMFHFQCLECSEEFSKQGTIGPYT